MTMRARLAAAVAGGAIALLPAAPAMADSQPVDIREDHVPTTAADFRPHECDGPLADLADGQDGWHFVLPADSGDAFESLTLTFDTPGGPVTAEITSTDAEAPSSADGWSGFLDGKHGWVFTDAGWTLTAGEGTVANAGKQAVFNLSHTCVGESDNGGGKPTPTPVPTPSQPGEGNGNGNGGGNGGGENGEDDEAGLPVTGMQVGGLVAIGAGLLGAGAVALLAVRRRRGLPAELTEG